MPPRPATAPATSAPGKQVSAVTLCSSLWVWGAACPAPWMFWQAPENSVTLCGRPFLRVRMGMPDSSQALGRHRMLAPLWEDQCPPEGAHVSSPLPPSLRVLGLKWGGSLSGSELPGLFVCAGRGSSFMCLSVPPKCLSDVGPFCRQRLFFLFSFTCEVFLCLWGHRVFLPEVL